MYILGINSAYHESAACIYDGATLLAAAEEERFTRVKHAKPATVNNPDELPVHAIQYCLDQASRRASSAVQLSDISHIGFSFRPDKRYEWHQNRRYPYPIDPANFGGRDGERTFHDKCSAVPEILRGHGFRGEFHFLDHHLCHAASSYFVTSLEHAAVLVIDGIGEYESTTLYRGTRSSLECVGCISYPDSLGFLWEKLSSFIGFTEYDGAKVMALAAYGDPRPYRDPLAHLISIDASFAVDDRIARFRVPDFSALERLFDLRKRDAPIERIGRAERPYADIAASLQEATERAVMLLAAKARDVDPDHLCLSGGVALNCASVGRVLRESGFAKVYVPPAAHDAGTAIGAAAYISHAILKHERRDHLSPYLGPSFTPRSIQQALSECGVAHEWCNDADLEDETARLIADGHIVGWMQGGMEFGPRALGNRSLLADPRDTEVMTKLYDAKHRYAFDPFAPCILQEQFAEWFETTPTVNLSSHYMVSTYRLLESRKSQVPAILHVNGTSRVQVVSKEYAPRLHRLIKAFQRITGTPLLLNTSFNDREPIVCSPADALRTAIRSGIDYVVIGNFIVPVRPNVVATTVPDIPLELYFEKLR